MENINFYTLKEVQKHMPKLNDEQKEYTGIQIGEHILACGKTGSGKSNCLLNYLVLTSKPKKPTFKKVFFVYKTWEPLYKYLQEKLKDNIIFFKGLNDKDFPSCNSFKDLSNKDTDRYLFVFDDCVNDKSTKDMIKIKDYYTFGRKKGFTIFFLTQSFFQTDQFFRKNTSWILLNGISGNRDLSTILRDYAVGDIDVKTMVNMYRYCKKVRKTGEINFMKICCVECPDDKRFSRNWLDYLNPNDFLTSKKDVKTNDKKQDDKSDDDMSVDDESDDDKDVYIKLEDLI